VDVIQTQFGLSSLPSVILAYIKLRKRNLGPILDTNGWAVNAKARISVPFGASLTGVARLPRGSRRDHRDRFAEKAFPVKRVVALGPGRLHWATTGTAASPTGTCRSVCTRARSWANGPPPAPPAK
jgi:hypothetical protein